MVAGGGASVVYADTISDYGFGKVGMPIRHANTLPRRVFCCCSTLPVVFDSCSQSIPSTESLSINSPSILMLRSWRTMESTLVRRPSK